MDLIHNILAILGFIWVASILGVGVIFATVIRHDRKYKVNFASSRDDVDVYVNPIQEEEAAIARAKAFFS